jgi:hypothetical protein
VTLEPVVDPYTQSPIGSISGNEVKLFPVESNNTQYVDVTNKVRQVQIGDQLVNRRSVAVDLSENAKTVISNAHQYARRNEANVLWQTNTFMSNTTMEANLTVNNGTITAPTINATTALQINGTSTNTLYATEGVGFGDHSKCDGKWSSDGDCPERCQQL